MRGTGCEAKRRAALAGRLAEADQTGQRADELLRQQWYTISGPYLEYRGMPNGTTVRVGPGLVTQGMVCLAASPEGVLAAGVARFDETGHLTVWSDWSGPATQLCCCDGARAVGLLVRAEDYNTVAAGSLLAWMLSKDIGPVVLPAWATG